jgi:hypothetical protein
MTHSEKTNEGLSAIDGDCLAAIVQTDTEGYGKLQSYEAKVAFRELARRSFGEAIFLEME